jgi:hypothetical protein
LWTLLNPLIELLGGGDYPREDNPHGNTDTEGQPADLGDRFLVFRDGLIENLLALASSHYRRERREQNHKYLLRGRNFTPVAVTGQELLSC